MHKSGDPMVSIKSSACLFFLCFFMSVVSASAASSNHSKLLSLEVADYMVSGQKYKVNIEYKNVGLAVWGSK